MTPYGGMPHGVQRWNLSVYLPPFARAGRTVAPCRFKGATWFLSLILNGAPNSYWKYSAVLGMERSRLRLLLLQLLLLLIRLFDRLRLYINADLLLFGRVGMTPHGPDGVLEQVVHGLDTAAFELGELAARVSDGNGMGWWS